MKRSAEAKAIERLNDVDNFITVVELGEPIDVDELNAQLKQSGYDIQISVDSDGQIRNDRTHD